MSVDEAINFIIAENCEGYAIGVLNKSNTDRLADEYVKTSRLSATIKAIEKINRLNNNNRERREGISALCEDIEMER